MDAKRPHNSSPKAASRHDRHTSAARPRSLLASVLPPARKVNTCRSSSGLDTTAARLACRAVVSGLGGRLVLVLVMTFLPSPRELPGSGATPPGPAACRASTHAHGSPVSSHPQ
jgi:hypothetical protein